MNVKYNLSGILVTIGHETKTTFQPHIPGHMGYCPVKVTHQLSALIIYVQQSRNVSFGDK